jgi:hypothetical protein
VDNKVTKDMVKAYSVHENCFNADFSKEGSVCAINKRYAVAEAQKMGLKIKKEENRYIFFDKNDVCMGSVSTYPSNNLKFFATFKVENGYDNGFYPTFALAFGHAVGKI